MDVLIEATSLKGEDEDNFYSSSGSMTQYQLALKAFWIFLYFSEMDGRF